VLVSKRWFSEASVGSPCSFSSSFTVEVSSPGLLVTIGPFFANGETTQSGTRTPRP